MQTEQTDQPTVKKDELTKYRAYDNFETDFENLLPKADDRGENISLVILDVDNFKNINSRHGYDCGDEVLKIIAKRLKEFFPGDHYFYRYGGDSFALVLDGVEKETAFLLTEKTREALSHEWVKNNRAGQFNFSVSAGVATYREDGTSVSDLVRKVTGALFRAKNSGRNKVAIAREEKLVTKTSHYSVDQLQRLSILAKETDTGEAFLLREALNDVLKKYDDKQRYQNGKTVMIVDDSSSMRASMRDILTRGGFKVLGEFENGRSAAEYYNSVAVDFVLLDIMMPTMDGIEFLKSINRRGDGIIIAVSAASRVSLVLSAVENGADYFIIKPFQQENLLNVLSWEADAFLQPSRHENYRAYYKGKRYGDDFLLSQVDIDAIRML